MWISSLVALLIPASEVLALDENDDDDVDADDNGIDVEANVPPFVRDVVIVVVVLETRPSLFTGVPSDVKTSFLEDVASLELMDSSWCLQRK